MTGVADSVELRRTGPVRVAGNEAAWPLQARPTIGGATMCVDIIDVMTFDDAGKITPMRSEEHTSELQSLLRISYAAFCLKKKKHQHTQNQTNTQTNTRSHIT